PDVTIPILEHVISGDSASAAHDILLDLMRVQAPILEPFHAWSLQVAYRALRYRRPLHWLVVNQHLTQTNGIGLEVLHLQVVHSLTYFPRQRARNRRPSPRLQLHYVTGAQVTGIHPPARKARIWRC